MTEDLRYTASMGDDPAVGSTTDPAVTVQALPNPRLGRSCRLCGTPIDAGMYGARRFCSSRCKTRYARGQDATPAPPKAKTYSTSLAHPGYSVEPCPRCGFPEADGGYCADCGWSLPRPGTPGGWPLQPAGSLHGPVHDQPIHRRSAA